MLDNKGDVLTFTQPAQGYSESVLWFKTQNIKTALLDAFLPDNEHNAVRIAITHLNKTRAYACN